MLKKVPHIAYCVRLVKLGRLVLSRDYSAKKVRKPMGTTAKPDTTGNTNNFDGSKAGIADGLEKELQRLKTDAELEVKKILTEARQQAQNITNQAEDRAKQEAIEKTKNDIQNIFGTAEDTANRIVTEARQNAQQQSDRIISNAKQEASIQSNTLKMNVLRAAEEMNSSAAELKKKAEKEAQEAREKARLDADKLIQQAKDKAKINVSKEEERIVAEAKHRGNAILDEAIKKAKESLEEASLGVDIVISRLKQYAKEITERSFEVPRSELSSPSSDKINEPLTSGDNESSQPHSLMDNTPLSVVALSEPAAEVTGPEEVTIQSVLSQDTPLSVDQLIKLSTTSNPAQEPTLYYGQVELHVTRPADDEQLQQFKEHLGTIPHVSVVQLNMSSPDGIIVTLSIEMAIPLFDIIKKLPSVKEAENVGKDVLVTLLNSRKRAKK